jgi:hypothetical protein
VERVRFAGLPNPSRHDYSGILAVLGTTSDQDHQIEAVALTIGSPARIEWAKEIRIRVSAEFDRVSSALQAAAKKQGLPERERTTAVLQILEDKRAEVMAINDSGYFIRDWQELTDQVRRMIAADPRYVPPTTVR